jgi:hypothetical protein
MKTSIILILIFFLSEKLIPQIDLRVGMGLDFFTSPSLVDYINQSGFYGSEELSKFSSAVNFSSEVGFIKIGNYQISTELAYQLYSYNSNVQLGRYDIEFTNILPSVLIYYLIEGKGYNFKFGGGGGLRIVAVEETLPASVSSDKFSNLGFGFLLRTQGNTLLSDKLFANISIDLRYDFNGVPKSNNRKLYNNLLREQVNINQLSFGIKLGFCYKF